MRPNQPCRAVAAPGATAARQRASGSGNCRRSRHQRPPPCAGRGCAARPAPNIRPAKAAFGTRSRKLALAIRMQARNRMRSRPPWGAAAHTVSGISRLPEVAGRRARCRSASSGWRAGTTPRKRAAPAISPAPRAHRGKGSSVIAATPGANASRGPPPRAFGRAQHGRSEVRDRIQRHLRRFSMWRVSGPGQDRRLHRTIALFPGNLDLPG
jgi:hypothetical protein